MSEIKTHVGHLEAARNRIHEERSSIQVVGRALTPEEEARLAALDGADADVESALGHLTQSVEANVDFPPDGRYAVANTTLTASLRIDKNVCGIVSGDIFALAGESREYLLSFRTAPGDTVEGESTVLLVIGEDVNGDSSVGVLNILSGDEDATTISISFDDALLGFTPNYAEQMVGRRESLGMRTLGIEIENEVGTEGNPEWVFNGRTMDIETCYQDAGFDTRRIGLASEIPQAPASGWDNSQLHGLMSDYAQASLAHSDWGLHLLMLSRATNPNLLGIMFDVPEIGDPNQLPRQGAAVFQDLMKPLGSTWLRKLLQTSVHELGHALNLAHPFEREIGRADSNSFMNYDWKYMGGNNTSKYWQDFQFTFNDEELAFLRHGPRTAVIPGGAGFHTIFYWKQGDGGYVPYVSDWPTNLFSLELTRPDNDGLYHYGQPVLLTVTFHNHLEGDFTLPSFFLDPKAGFLSFIVDRIGGTVPPHGNTDNIFRPIVMRCYDLDPRAADTIPSGGSMSNNVNLTYGSGGFTFAEPGDYEVTARLELWFENAGYRTLYSDPVNIRVAYPKTEDDERIGMQMFRNDIGCYFALGGSDVLSDAESALIEIEERRQGKAKTVSDGLVANIRRSRAINMAREFVRYKDGQYTRRPADPEKAHLLLNTIGRKMKTFFDPATAAATQFMVSVDGKKSSKS
jgi:hypothetical protein